MFQHFSGRSVILIHASLGLVFFAYMGACEGGKYAELRGRHLTVSDETADTIRKEQMASASRISLIFSSAFFFLLSVWLMAQQTELNFGLVQRSTLGKRLDFCMTLCLYICFFSSLFNAIQLMDDDNMMLTDLDGNDTVLDLGRPVEWMLTCPLMQLALPILAGEKIPDSRRFSMPAAALTVLSFGLVSTIASNIVFKALAYCAGVLAFCVMLSFMNACIMDASDGGENLLSGTSFLRGLTVVIALTWFPFPIWYALSPEGFNIIKDEEGMKLAVAFLNVFSKGAFIMYLSRIRTDFSTRQKTMISVGYMKDMETDPNVSAEKDGDDEVVNKLTQMLIKDVLESMGRAKDQDHVVRLLQAHLITTNEDILALTKDYCREIDLPWGLVIALKSKIRSYYVQSDDGWTMNAGQKVAEVNFSAPHVARNEQKIKTVARRQTSKDLSISPHMGDDMSDMASNPGYPTSAGSLSTRGPQSSATPKSSYVSGPGSSRLGETPSQSGATDEFKTLMESHQRAVNGQVDECRQFVVHSMDKIMYVLEQRMAAEGNAPIATAGPANANISQAAAPSHA
jgi:bacteriorhodopsin